MVEDDSFRNIDAIVDDIDLFLNPWWNQLFHQPGIGLFIEDEIVIGLKEAPLLLFEVSQVVDFRVSIRVQGDGARAVLAFSNFLICRQVFF